MTGFIINGTTSVPLPVVDPITLQPKENPTVNLASNITVKTNTDIVKGAPVAFYSYDSDTNIMVVKLADQLVELAVGVLGQTTSSGNLGPLIRTGTLSGINTSSYSTNAVLYVGTNILTDEEPARGNKQMIAQVLNSDINGSILIDTNFFIPSASSITYGDTTIDQALEQSIIDNNAYAKKQRNHFKRWCLKMVPFCL